MRQEYDHRQTIKNEGWGLNQRDSIAFNGGKDTESLQHFLAKAAIGWVLKQEGFRVSSEVEGPTGIIDIVAYGTEDVPVAVEVERDLKDDVMQDKLERYCRSQPFRDVLPVDVDTMPSVDSLQEWAETRL